MKLKYLTGFSSWIFFALLLLQISFVHDILSMNRARIKPTIVKVNKGGEQQFYVVKEPGRLTSAYATNKVKWYVNGIAGGDEVNGTISDGLYKAPQKAPQSSEIHIMAEVESSSNSYLWATVLYNGERPAYKTLKEWGESIDALQHFKDPQALAIENNGNILIADGTIKRFSNDGQFITEMAAARGDKIGSLETPVNILVDDEGLIFVSDKRTGTPRIQVFSPDGKYLYSFATKGTGEGRVMDTRGAAFDSKGRLYIGDIDNMRVSVFEHNGEFVKNLGKKGIFPGEFNVPYGLALDRNDDLFVASYFGPCQKLTSDGHYLFSFSYPDPPNGHIYITDLASDSWGDIYLIVKGAAISEGRYQQLKDLNGNQVNIIKYNNNGDFITNLKLSGENRDALRLIIDDSGRVIVLFQDENTIGVEFLKK